MIPIEALKAVTRIIVHADCADGTASAMILNDALPGREIIAVGYGPQREALEPGPGDLFCDMTPPESKVNAFVAAGAIVLDHHRGARELVARFGDLGVYADADEEPGVSGAVLAFEVWRQLTPFLVSGRSEAIQTFAKFAGIRDTWQSDDVFWDGACAQAEALSFYPLSFWLSSARPYLAHEERKLGAALLDKKRRRAREIAETACLRLSSSVAIFNDAPKPDSRISDVAEAMREIDPNVKLVCSFFYSVRDGAMLLELHFRSSPGADRTAFEIAVANGGGGHEHAASFTLPVRRLGYHSPLHICKACL